MRVQRIGRGFTLIELLVVIAIISVLASIIIVGIAKVQGEAQIAKTQNRVQQFGLAVQRYRTKLMKWPCKQSAKGDFNPDDCWRELAPYVDTLTAGIQPADPTYQNRNLYKCMDIPEDWMEDVGDGKMHVVDSFKRPFAMQYDWFNKKIMIWSAGNDETYNMSDVPNGNPLTFDGTDNEAHSSLFADKTQAQDNNPPIITDADKTTKVELDISNY